MFYDNIDVNMNYVVIKFISNNIKGIYSFILLILIETENKFKMPELKQL